MPISTLSSDNKSQPMRLVVLCALAGSCTKFKLLDLCGDFVRAGLPLDDEV